MGWDGEALLWQRRCNACLQSVAAAQGRKAVESTRGGVGGGRCQHAGAGWLGPLDEQTSNGRSSLVGADGRGELHAIAAVHLWQRDAARKGSSGVPSLVSPGRRCRGLLEGDTLSSRGAKRAWMGGLTPGPRAGGTAGPAGAAGL